MGRRQTVRFCHLPRLGQTAEIGWLADIAHLVDSAHNREMLFQLISTMILLTASAKTPNQCVPPLSGWAATSSGKSPYVLWNTVSLHGRQIRWNGVPISQPTLASYLRRGARMNPIPVIVFHPDFNDCWFDRRIQHLLARSFPCRSGICFQGSPQAFKAAPWKRGRGSPA